MTDAAAQRLTRSLAEAGLRGWTPPGDYDPDTGVWFTNDQVENRFPEEGIERFSHVDDRSFWFAHRNGVILDRLTRFAGASALFVEVGSGSGVVGRFLELVGYRVVCVEPHVSGAVHAARRGVTASFCGDLASLRLPDHSVTNIGAFDVIEHLEDPVALLREVRRVLAADGLLLLTVPAFQWLWSDFDVWNGHVERFSARRLSKVLSLAGLSMTEHSYFFAPLVVPVYLMRIVRRLLGRSRTLDEVGASVEAELDPSLRIVDTAIRKTLAVESRILRRWRIPFGTSLLAVARPTPSWMPL